MITPSTLLRCNQCGVDSDVVAAEHSDFRKTYKLLRDGENELISKTKSKGIPEHFPRTFPR